MGKEYKVDYTTHLKSSMEIINYVTRVLNSNENSTISPQIFGEVVPQEINKVLKCLEVLGLHHRIFIIPAYSTEGQYTPTYKIGILPSCAYIDNVVVKSEFETIK